MFLPGKFHAQRSLAGYIVQLGHKESDTTEWPLTKKTTKQCVFLQQMNCKTVYWKLPLKIWEWNLHPYTKLGLPWWLSGKESACNAGATGASGLIPGSGRSHGGGNGNPLQYSCLDNPMDREAWRSGKELDMTEPCEHTVRAQMQVTDIKEIYNFLLVFILST